MHTQAVDAKSCRNRDFEEIKAFLRGPVGSYMTLTVRTMFSCVHVHTRHVHTQTCICMFFASLQTVSLSEPVGLYMTLTVRTMFSYVNVYTHTCLSEFCFCENQIISESESYMIYV